MNNRFLRKSDFHKEGIMRPRMNSWHENDTHEVSNKVIQNNLVLNRALNVGDKRVTDRRLSQ